MAVPVRLDLLAQVQQRNGRLVQAVTRALEERRIHLEGLVRGIPRLDMIVAQKTQDLDALSERLADAPQRMMTAKGEQLAMLSGRLNLDRFTADLRRHGMDVQNLAERAGRALVRSAQDAANRLDNLMTRLESVSPKRVLERGYALVRDAGGTVVTSAAAAAGALEIEFADGKVAAHAAGAAASKPARPAPKKSGGDSGQGTLL
jgi:exodeoxyribonuclease VII large subunit